MARKVTICSLQWGDMPLEKVCETMSGLGYDGIELGLIGDHFDVEAAAKSKGWCDDLKGRLAAHGLGCRRSPPTCRDSSCATSTTRGTPASRRRRFARTLRRCARGR